MKKLCSRLVIFSLVTFTLLSCMERKKKVPADQAKSATTSVSKPNTGAYQPGLDWKLVWADEFKGNSIDATNWTYQVEEAGRFNEEWQRYTNSSKNAYIADDCLVIKAIHESESHGMDQYTSARLHTAKKHSWKYGKIAARIKLPEGKGIWPAFWMLGANIDENGGDTPWPQSGEIDILELYGSKDDAVIEVNLHYADASGSHANMGAAAYKLKQGKFSDAFHVFELEWDDKEIAWFVDGVQVAFFPITSEELSEFHREFFLLFNVAVGGTFAGRPDDTTSFPQHMYVDWVRVYQKMD